MYILLNDFEVDARCEAKLLTDPDVTFVALNKSEDAAEACSGSTRSDSPLLVVTRVPLPEHMCRRRPELTVLFPGTGAGPDRVARGVGVPWLVPGVTVGPLVGRPEAEHRALAARIRTAGVPVTCRRNMHYWLRVTAAWLAPLHGAVLAARERGVCLAQAEDLITVAARAARERLRVMRAGGLPVDLRYRVLHAMPEAWAIAMVRRVVEALPEALNPTWLPSATEAVEVGQQVARMAACLGLRAPAADFLDQFSAEEAARSRGPAPSRDAGTTLLEARADQNAPPSLVSNG